MYEYYVKLKMLLGYSIHTKYQNLKYYIGVYINEIVLQMQTVQY